MANAEKIRYISRMPARNISSASYAKSTIAGLLAAICLASVCRGADRSPLKWRTGAELNQQIQSPAAVVWSDVRLEDALNSLSDAHRVCIFLDRRVDPNQLLNLDQGGVPFLGLVRDAAASVKLGVGMMGPVVYVGPPQHADLAATAAAYANEQFGPIAKHATDHGETARILEWEQLSQPRQLISEFATRNGLRIKNLEAIPHDLWQSRRLPEMRPGEQLALLLIGFDLYFRIDPAEREIILTRFPKSLTIRREYATTRDGGSMAEKLSKAFPQVFLQGKPESILVRGTYEQQEAIRPWIENGGNEPKADPVKPTKGPLTHANERFTLKIEHQPLKPLMTVLARRLGLTLEWNGVTEDQSTMRVSFDVKEVTREALVDAVLNGTNVTAEFQGEHLILSGSANP